MVSGWTGTLGAVTTSPPTAALAVEMTLTQWVQQPKQPDLGLQVEDSWLVASGVAGRAVREYRAAMDTHPDDGSLTGVLIADDRMRARLQALAANFPEMTLAEAVGWVLVAVHLNRHWFIPQVLAFVNRWVQAGLGRDAMVYAAAGLTPEEARRVAADKTITLDQVRAMAALRG